MGKEAIQGGEMFDRPSSIIYLQAFRRSKKFNLQKFPFMKQENLRRFSFFFTPWSTQLIIHEGQAKRTARWKDRTN
jgi:hypothetical protein